MREYIEREALLDEINIAPVSMSICMNVDECKGRIYERERLVRIINEATAADVVEVVRCGECAYHDTADYGGGYTKNVRRLLNRQIQDDDYCSYAWKKDVDA